MGMSTIGIMAVATWLMECGAVQYVDLESGWEYRHVGPWQLRVDHRDLLAMHHPWVPSAEGNMAMALREIEIPTDWQGPVALAFYTSDDYHTIPDDPNAAALAAEGFIGHRRRQVFVNDTLVWSEDVSDPVEPGASPYVFVPLELPDGARAFRLGLVAYDILGSADRTKDDYYRPSKAGLTPEDDPDRDRFRTTVYWGDLALVTGDMALTTRPRPTARRVLERHNRTWPPKPSVSPWAKKNVTLDVSAPSGLPESGFPLTMGIPFPEGVVKDPGAFRLRAGGASFPVQKTVTSVWPDGSLRWVQVRAPIGTKTKALELSFREDSSAMGGEVAQTGDENGALHLNAGLVALDMGPGDPISNISYRGASQVETVRLAMEIGGEVTPGTGDVWRVVESGPLATEVALDGRFEGLNEANGSFELFVTVFSGLPYVKCWLRVFNDTGANLNLSHLKMEFVLSAPPAGVRLPHGPVEEDFRLSQSNVDAYRLGNEDHEVPSPMYVAWDNGALAVKYFRELHPKGIERRGNVLALDLFAGGNRPVTLTPGEAKSHEIWLGLGKQDGAALVSAVERPPILQNAQYWCDSGAFGPAAALPVDHPFSTFLAERYGEKGWRDLGQATGLRHFPDSAYMGRADAWSNNYNERMMGLWSCWAMTGERIWFDRAVAVSEHLQDVAIVHSKIAGRDWLGAMHGPGLNHVAGPWEPMLRGDGFSYFGHLTGNPAAKTTLLGVADYCVRTEAGLKGASARHVAGPFSTICAAYRETGEITFLEAGTERLTAMANRVDRRRGVWFDWHGSEVYPGTVPWMAAQLAGPLYTWYRLTGDVEAAYLLVGMAEALICENTPWETPGAMATYSPNPRYPSSAALDPFIIPLLCAAYELSEDDFFRDAARAQWERWLAQPAYQDVFQLSWHWPWLNACVEDMAVSKPE